MAPSQPAHRLAHVKGSVARGEFILTRSAGVGVAALGFDISDVRECIAALTLGHLYKSEPSAKKPGTFQDVYRKRFRTKSVYLKVQVDQGKVVVISFKRDESPRSL